MKKNKIDRPGWPKPYETIWRLVRGRGGFGQCESVGGVIRAISRGPKTGPVCNAHFTVLAKLDDGTVKRIVVHSHGRSCGGWLITEPTKRHRKNPSSRTVVGRSEFLMSMGPRLGDPIWYGREDEPDTVGSTGRAQFVYGIDEKTSMWVVRTDSPMGRSRAAVVYPGASGKWMIMSWIPYADLRSRVIGLDEDGSDPTRTNPSGVKWVEQHVGGPHRRWTYDAGFDQQVSVNYAPPRMIDGKPIEAAYFWAVHQGVFITASGFSSTLKDAKRRGLEKFMAIHHRSGKRAY